MSGSRDIQAGAAFVKLYARDDELRRTMRRVQSQLRTFASTASAAGAGLLGGGSVAAAPFAISTTVFAKFETQMSRVRALTNATEDEFSRLSERAKRLGETTVFAASQAAEAMAVFAQAGLKTGDIIAATGPTLDLAAAGALSIADAASIAIKVSKGMGIAIDDLGGVMDLLTKAMTTANTDLIQIGEAMKFVGPVARTAGIDLAEIVAAIQKLADAGLGGEMAGTALRGVLLAIASPADVARKKMQEIGISVEDAAGRILPLVDILRQFERAFEGMTQVERLDALGRIFENRQVAGFATLLAQGSDALAQATAALADSEGVAGRIASIQLNNLGGEFTLLKSAAEGLAIAVGESLAAPIRIGLRAVKSLTGGLTAWAKQNKDLIVIAAGTTTAVLAVGGILFGVGVAAQVAAFATGGLIAALGAVGSIVAAAGSAFAFMLTPVGLVGAALGVLAYRALGIGEIVADAAGRIVGSVTAMRTVLQSTLNGMTAALAGGSLEQAAQIGAMGIRVVWLSLTQTIRQTWAQAVGDVAGYIYTLAGVFDAAVATLENIWARLGIHMRTVMDVAGFAVMDIFDSIRTDLQSLFDFATGGFADMDAYRERDAARYTALRERQNKRAVRVINENSGRPDAISDLDFDLIERWQKIADAVRDGVRDIDDGTRRQIEDQITELEKARKKLADAIAEAEGEDGAARDAGNMARGIRDAIEAAMRGAASRIEIQGGFDQRALDSISGDDRLAERTAAAAEQTARNTKRIADDASMNGGLVYA